jgi:hypothetical protein
VAPERAQSLKEDWEDFRKTMLMKIILVRTSVNNAVITKRYYSHSWKQNGVTGEIFAG